MLKPEIRSRSWEDVRADAVAAGRISEESIELARQQISSEGVE